MGTVGAWQKGESYYEKEEEGASQLKIRQAIIACVIVSSRKSWSGKTIFRDFDVGIV